MDLQKFINQCSKKKCNEDGYLVELINDEDLDFSVIDFNQYLWITPPFSTTSFDIERKKHFVDINLLHIGDVITNVSVTTNEREHEEICLVLSGMLYPLSSKTLIPMIAMRYCQVAVRIFFNQDCFPQIFRISGHNMFAQKNTKKNVRRFLETTILQCDDFICKNGTVENKVIKPAL